MDYLENLSADIALFKSITAEQAWHYSIIPKEINDEYFSFFISENTNQTAANEELEFLLNKTIRFEAISNDLIKKYLNKYYRKSQPSNNLKKGEVLNQKDDDFLMNIISEAKSLGSSDIHIEASESTGRIRIRIDGMLIERYLIPKTDYPSLINKIKIKANLDIAEKRLPQDGRIFFKHNDYKFDIRISILPTLHGEKVVLRILSNDATSIDINQLGFEETELNNYLKSINKPHGIVLISGPTGSGKTTTLYASLKILNKEKTNILTIEDPIEYTLPGINQVQLKESIGLTFASALRTFLRQDPDVIMLGEIRDPETAQMAIRAALTGHLVLSTIHTNSACGIVSRLVDMDVPPYLIASTLHCTIAQRLIRLLCNHCKQSAPFDANILPNTYKALNCVKMHYVPSGCENCYYTGYSGRMAIYEVIPIDSILAEQIKLEKFQIREYLSERQIMSLADNAIRLFKNGQTSVEEIYPILSIDANS